MKSKTETLNYIRAKIALALPLTERERALWTLYGEGVGNGD